MSNFCYWSIGDGEHGKMLRTLVKSARSVGVTEDIHVWSDIDIPDCTVHKIGTNSFDKSLYLFKLHFLRDEVSKLDYRYYIFLDADNFFVRKPPRILLNGSSPLHVTLESYCPNPENRRPDWWNCPLIKYEELMRSSGVYSKHIYNCNAGFWIVDRLAIDVINELCFTFHDFCKQKGYTFTEEAPLAYAMQMLCADTEPHTLHNTSDVWASDWIGIYKDKLPDGKPFEFEDYFTGKRFIVDPAIVHAMRSKDVMKNG
jgi:hypothetical protein